MSENHKDARAASVAFLNEAASYFEKRPTNGEDMAHWANVFNAKNCIIAAGFIEADATRLAMAIEALEKALEFADKIVGFTASRVSKKLHATLTALENPDA